MPAKLDMDKAKGVITITPEDNTIAPTIITKVDIDSYLEVLATVPKLYCYKSTKYDPVEMSPVDGRYSKGGCLYTTESVSAAQAEVGDWQFRNLYSVSAPGPIYALNFTRLADDFDIRDLVTQEVSAGGWEPTQEFADYFTGTLGLTALIVPSTKAADNCFNFYADNRLPDDFLTLCSSPISTLPPTTL